MKELMFWHRERQQLTRELVFGEVPLKWVHRHPVGQALMNSLFSRKVVSRGYGYLQSTPRSKQKIPKFVDQFQIDMSEYEVRDYTSFNDFFIRKFKAGLRPFDADPRRLPAPAEARYLAFRAINDSTGFPIKGMTLRYPQLLNFHKLAPRFEGGPALIARLCPTDYHRFHYPDDGKTLESLRAGTKLYSVSPFALQMKGDILESNERVITFLETENFGLLAYVEVGALFVGKIVQSHCDEGFKRGDEKGHFLFGGSTVVVVGEKGRWVPDSDLLQKTAEGLETWCKLGTSIAQRS